MASVLEHTVPGRWDQYTVASVEDANSLVSERVSLVFRVVNFGVIVQIIDLFGTGSNILNIICFVKQGFKDAGNISMLGLSISDLLSMATLTWTNLCLTTAFYEYDLPFDSPYIAHLTTGIHHVALTGFSCWLTAFISLERCLCVTLPLKIKRILTPKTAIIINVTIFTIVYCGSITPVYYTTRFAVLPHPHKPNTTWLGIAFTKDRLIGEKFTMAINNCFLLFGAFLIISVTTTVMVVRLRSNAKWRHKATAQDNCVSMSHRDQFLSKMVVMISTMFVICYIPICAIFIGMLLVPEFSISGRFKNLTTIVVSFSVILESVNASFNIFIYYSVSSRYRHTFRQTFCTLRNKCQNINLNNRLSRDTNSSVT